METVRGNGLSKRQNRVGSEKNKQKENKREEETNRREGKIKANGQNPGTVINTDTVR